jgi:hypothetical protein
MPGLALEAVVIADNSAGYPGSADSCARVCALDACIHVVSSAFCPASSIQRQGSLTSLPKTLSLYGTLLGCAG